MGQLSAFEEGMELAVESFREGSGCLEIYIVFICVASFDTAHRVDMEAA